MVAVSSALRKERLLVMLQVGGKVSYFSDMLLPKVFKFPAKSSYRLLPIEIVAFPSLCWTGLKVAYLTCPSVVRLSNMPFVTSMSDRVKDDPGSSLKTKIMVAVSFCLRL